MREGSRKQSAKSTAWLVRRLHDLGTGRLVLEE